MSAGSTRFREPSAAEIRLLRTLAALSPALGSAWLEELLVREMNDGGMGSLELQVRGRVSSRRAFGSKAAEWQFTDEDGVVALSTLYLDAEGVPYELDIWKTDFSPLIRLPE
jgi:hypothetical protein